MTSWHRSASVLEASRFCTSLAISLSCSSDVLPFVRFLATWHRRRTVSSFLQEALAMAQRVWYYIGRDLINTVKKKKRDKFTRKIQADDQMWRRTLYVTMFIAASCCNLCHAQSGSDTVAYINEVENEVQEIAKQAVINFNNTCDLVQSCGGNCSRQACVPLQDDSAGYQCKHVAYNPNCYSEATNTLGCQDLRVSLTRSYVRVPTSSNVSLTKEANASICSQRMLDPTFKNISSSHNSALNLTTWAYFASVEGVHRAFPGRDVAANNCTFEARKRPWYKGVTAVKKDVVVLLDAGNSMGDNLPGDLLVTASTSKFQATLSILLDFLDTLAFGDRITIVTFTSTSAATPIYPPLTVNDTNIQYLRNALQPLNPDTTQGASNLTAGFLTANSTFKNNNALKAILTFTDGQVTVNPAEVNGTVTVYDSFRTQQVLVQIFSYDRSTSETTTLSQVACTCNGTYEKISETVSNPLWTLRSYYGILARIRLTAEQNKPSWTNVYQDDGSLGSVITVVYPAFADNYTLIGVAGIDVLIEELGSMVQSDFSTALVSHGSTESLVNLVSSPIPCNFAVSTANECNNVTAPANSLCQMTDTSGQSFEERVCNCPGVCLASAVGRANKSTLKAAQIAGIGVGTAAFVILAILLAVFYVRKKKRKVQPGKTAVSSATTTPLTSSFANLAKLGSSPMSPLKSPRAARSRTLRANSNTWGSLASKDLTEYTQEELRIATDNWSSSTELGRGAHGMVYKGTFPDGTVVAIKKPTRGLNQDAWDTFATELELLSKLNHKRLVRLLGYCTDEIILVYEFMENGTLADWLRASSDANRKLGWESRLRIAMGAAKGLEYLHEYAVPKIYHGDVKPANILLDQNYEAHVSDFGLSLWSQDEKNSYLMASRMGGTFGYLDPEFVSSGQATFASDVYSFGIVILELMSGRGAVVDCENIKDWAAELDEEDALESKFLDQNLEKPVGGNLDVLIEVVRLALKCVERKKQDRPKMKDVASALDHAWNYWVRSQQTIPEDFSAVVEPR